MHKTCSIELADNDFICHFCMRGESLNEGRSSCHQEQLDAAKKMINYSSENHGSLEVGDFVTLYVPNVDRGPLDFPSICGVITKTKHGLYQIGTKEGIISGYFPRSSLSKSDSEFFTPQEIDRAQVVTLRQASSYQSKTGGQGFFKCNCKTNCTSKRCTCAREGVSCNSRCHPNKSCKNK